MPEEKSITAKMMERVKAEWINDYRRKLRKGMGELSTRKPMSEYDEGYNACLDDCIMMLDIMEE